MPETVVDVSLKFLIITLSNFNLLPKSLGGAAFACPPSASFSSFEQIGPSEVRLQIGLELVGVLLDQFL